MSAVTHTTDDPAAPERAAPGSTASQADAPRTQVDLSRTKVTFPRVVRSEWTKLRTLRSTWITLVIALALSVGIAALIGSTLGSTGPDGQGGPPPQVLADIPAALLAGTLFASLVLGVLGALAASTEYSTGTVRATLTAVPKRLPVLAATVVVVVLVAAVAGAALSAAAFWTGSVLLDDPLSAGWGDDGVVAALVGNTGYLVAITLLGLGLGMLARSTAGAITVLVAVVFLLPSILPFMSADWVQTINDYLPGTAGASLQATNEKLATLSRSAAALTLTLWALVPLVVAGLLMKRRDA